jgi:hypothetical protein
MCYQATMQQPWSQAQLTGWAWLLVQVFADTQSDQSVILEVVVS